MSEYLGLEKGMGNMGWLFFHVMTSGLEEACTFYAMVHNIQGVDKNPTIGRRSFKEMLKTYLEDKTILYLLE